MYEHISEYKVLRDDEVEKILLITKNSQSGILSNRYGEVVSASFNDIINIGTPETPVFFAEKYILEADFYVIIYYDGKGEIIRKQIFKWHIRLLLSHCLLCVSYNYCHTFTVILHDCIN